MKKFVGVVILVIVGNMFIAPTTWGTRFPLDVPYFNSSYGGWENGQLGWCSGVTIKYAGCALTSVAMVLKYYGADVDPGRLNTWLKNNGGYSGCAIYWEKPPSYLPGSMWLAVKAIPMSAFDWNRLRSELDNCHPVIVHVYIPGKGDHYVVVKGYSGNRFYINDSYLNKQWLDEYGTPDQMIVYYGNTCKEAPCPSITLNSGLPQLPCLPYDGASINYSDIRMT
ncbi:C39 family peptidase [candidate division KSB1 bacterium]|nr:C39 family peptidase [candidate division KSB1 bacterium]